LHHIFKKASKYWHHTFAFHIFARGWSTLLLMAIKELIQSIDSWPRIAKTVFLIWVV